MLRPLIYVAMTCIAISSAVAQANPVYRANRSFYTAMWTTNPPEYTTAGQSVTAGTMHWRVIRADSDTRFEPRQVTGLGTWWQPSDPMGAFPRNVRTLEFRFYPATTDANGLLIPDLAQPPHLTIPEMAMPVATGGNFKSITIALGTAMPITNTGDLAICGVYPHAANSTAPGYFGLLPSASNETYGLAQSLYGFADPNGTITHFGLGGARSSLWFTESQPTVNMRANWAISDSHNQNGHLNAAFGDATYFSPITDPTWAGWSDSRNPATIGWSVFAAGQDGDLVVPLFNIGQPALSPIAALGVFFEIDLANPVLGVLSGMTSTVTNGRADIDFPLMTAADPVFAGTYLGFEFLLVDPAAQLNGSTQAVWVQN